MKGKWLLLSLIFALYIPLMAGADEEPAAKAPLEFNVLWDKTGEIYFSWHTRGHYSVMGKRMLGMGATVTELNRTMKFSDDALKDIDLVIICRRLGHMFKTEQEALVRYIREGGALLVISDSTAFFGAPEPPYFKAISFNDTASVNPVLKNFGMQFTGGQKGSSKMNVFIPPATTDRRPVAKCGLDMPIHISTTDGATLIAGRDMSETPAAMDYSFIAMGGGSGKGRVIAVGDGDLWMDPPAMPPTVDLSDTNWFDADNAKLFANLLEYLLGFSDLTVVKVKCKDSLALGATAKFKARIKNLEAFWSKESKVTFYLSKNRKVEADTDIELGSAEIPEIKGGGEKTVKINAEIPSDVEPGDWFVLALIDLTDPRELNGGNNKGSCRVTIY